MPISKSERSRLSFHGTIRMTGQGGTTVVVARVVSAETVRAPANFRNDFASRVIHRSGALVRRCGVCTAGRNVASIRAIVRCNSPGTVVTGSLPTRRNISLVVVKTANLGTVRELFVNSMSRCIVHGTPYSILMIQASLRGGPGAGGD